MCVCVCTAHSNIEMTFAPAASSDSSWCDCDTLVTSSKELQLLNQKQSSRIMAQPRSWNWLLLLPFLVFFVFLPPSASAGSVNDCHGVRYAYQIKGWDPSEVPRQPRQGKTLLNLIMNEQLRVSFIGFSLHAFGKPGNDLGCLV